MEIVRWVSENVRPFDIVSDDKFRSLMKTGRLEYYLPSPSTVSRDVQFVFARTWQHIAKMLQEYKGRVSFTTDAWMSPNHRSFVAFCVHMEREGSPMTFPLDVIEVAKVSNFLNTANVVYSPVSSHIPALHLQPSLQKC